MFSLTQGEIFYFQNIFHKQTQISHIGIVEPQVGFHIRLVVLRFVGIAVQERVVRGRHVGHAIARILFGNAVVNVKLALPPDAPHLVQVKPVVVKELCRVHGARDVRLPLGEAVLKNRVSALWRVTVAGAKPNARVAVHVAAILARHAAVVWVMEAVAPEGVEIGCRRRRLWVACPVVLVCQVLVVRVVEIKVLGALRERAQAATMPDKGFVAPVVCVCDQGFLVHVQPAQAVGNLIMPACPGWAPPCGADVKRADVVENRVVGWERVLHYERELRHVGVLFYNGACILF